MQPTTNALDAEYNKWKENRMINANDMCVGPECDQIATVECGRIVKMECYRNMAFDCQLHCLHEQCLARHCFIHHRMPCTNCIDVKAREIALHEDAMEDHRATMIEYKKHFPISHAIHFVAPKVYFAAVSLWGLMGLTYVVDNNNIINKSPFNPSIILGTAPFLIAAPLLFTKPPSKPEHQHNFPTSFKQKVDMIKKYY